MGAAAAAASLPTMSGPTTGPGPTAVGFAMRETTPSIHLIARPSIDIAGMREYLEVKSVWLSTGVEFPNPFVRR